MMIKMSPPMLMPMFIRSSFGKRFQVPGYPVSHTAQPPEREAAESGGLQPLSSTAPLSQLACLVYRSLSTNTAESNCRSPWSNIDR